MLPGCSGFPPTSLDVATGCGTNSSHCRCVNGKLRLSRMRAIEGATALGPVLSPGGLLVNAGLGPDQQDK